MQMLVFLIDLNDSSTSPDYCEVYSFDKPDELINRIFYRDGKLHNQAIKYCYDFSGESCFKWRQGVKHDCSKIMELSLCNERLINGLKETVDIELKYVFPLIKSSMFKSAIISASNKYVIVTQKKSKRIPLI